MDPWAPLSAHRQQTAGVPIPSLFEDPDRVRDFALTVTDPAFGSLYFDYSRTAIDRRARDLLLGLTRDLPAARDAMYTGAPINTTEGRAVLHTALRNLDGSVIVDGADILPDIRATLARMEQFARDLRDGRIRGTGGRITDVVNIGIGGSDLGPAMAVQALSPYHDGPRVHFVSNVDGAHVADVLDGLAPETTLVIVASKTFTTIETMTNARTMRDWMARAVPEPTRQFVALSTALDQTAAFGIDPARVFGFGDWVGGRYSVWGPIGLSLMIAIGPENFRAFLAGAAAMDRHFRAAPAAENLPVLLALTGIWHNQICGYPTRAVLPYEQRLARLPAYLQQLEMESNGKRVALDGSELTRPSGPVVWGEPGTNGQHAFYQLIHQGTQIVPCEFMVAARARQPQLAHHHDLLVANCLAQAEALMQGRDLDTARALMAARGLTGAALETAAAHRVFPGNRPSTLLIYPLLTPAVLGAVLALYEHRVFVEGVILGINSFDQWGVELGKELAMALLPALRPASAAVVSDPATAAALERIKTLRATPG